MQTPVFRGKRKDNNEWAYGDLVHYTENDYRILPQYDKSWDILEAGFEIIPETLCEHTGFKDRFGEGVYLNSIIEADEDMYHGSVKGKVIWNNGYYVMDNITEDIINLLSCSKIRILGNIFDHCELLKA